MNIKQHFKGAGDGPKNVSRPFSRSSGVVRAAKAFRPCPCPCPQGLFGTPGFPRKCLDNPGFVFSPIFVAYQTFVELPGGKTGQFLSEVDRPGAFVVGEVFPAVLQ